MLVAIFRKNQGTNKMNLDNVKMNVVETAKNGVVDQATIFSFAQTDSFVTATYSGGLILQGYLVGTVHQNKLSFSYCQLQTNGKIDNGSSECEISVENGKIKLVEHFIWTSRNGEHGFNIFKEL